MKSSHPNHSANPSNSLPLPLRFTPASSFLLLGPVNTYFAARDGDGFHQLAQGMNRAAEQASVSGEQRRAGRNPSRPFGLRAKNAGAMLQSLAIGRLCHTLRALPAHFSRSNAGAK